MLLLFNNYIFSLNSCVFQSSINILLARNFLSSISEQCFIASDCRFLVSSECFLPKAYVFPCELNQLRVPNAPNSTSSDYSDIYEFPNIEALDCNKILGIRKIEPYNDLLKQIK